MFDKMLLLVLYLTTVSVAVGEEGDYSCNFEIGDGSGGTKKFVGYKATAQECVDSCVIEKETDSDINGVTVTSCGAGNCFCEKNMVDSDMNRLSFKTCLLHKGNDTRDGGYSMWSSWSSCSASCGYGNTTRSRECKNPSPAGPDAKNCSDLGPSNQTKSCYLKPCHNYSCNFEKGDGVGGTEENIGYKPSPQACIDACLNKKQTDPAINGVTVMPCGAGDCYCEKNMVNSNNNPSWKTCTLQLENHTPAAVLNFHGAACDEDES